MADELDQVDALGAAIGDVGLGVLAYTRDVARRAHAAGSAPTLWVHVIHGTWANPAKARVRPAWFEPGGAFEEALRTHGSSADWQQVRFAAAPLWSGKNSFAARAAAIGELEDYFRSLLFDHATTFDRHVVIAHSHGGTVAAEALRGLGPLAKEFSGLLTLGTPFVQRVRKAEPEDTVSFDSLTGVYAHAVAFFFGFTLALCFLFEGHAAMAAGCTAVAVMPWLLARIARLAFVAELLNAVIPWAAGVVFFASSRTGSPGQLALAAAGALLVAGILGPRLLMLHPLRFLDPSDGRQEHQLPPPLQTELLAIRAPGDEASLAISAASAAVWLSNAFSALGPGALRRIPNIVYAAFSLAGLGALVGLLAFPGHAFWQWTAMLTWAVPIAMPLAALMLALLLKAAGTIVIAAACGIEALQAPGITTIVAEPLPRARNGLTASAVLRMVFPTAADLAALRRKGAMRHAIYDYPSVQEYVAQWVLEHAPGTAHPVQPSR